MTTMLAFAILVMLISPSTHEMISARYLPHVYPTRIVCMAEMAKLPEVPFTVRACVRQEGRYA